MYICTCARMHTPTKVIFSDQRAPPYCGAETFSDKLAPPGGVKHKIPAYIYIYIYGCVPKPLVKQFNKAPPKLFHDHHISPRKPTTRDSSVTAEFSSCHNAVVWVSLSSPAVVMSCDVMWSNVI